MVLGAAFDRVAKRVIVPSSGDLDVQLPVPMASARVLRTTHIGGAYVLDEATSNETSDL
jgi:hypothetical protein